MKKQFSKRIGAILTTIAMLTALLPVAIPVMATGENLLVNGDFSSTALDGTAGWVENDTSSDVIKVIEVTPETVTGNNTLSGNVLYWKGTNVGVTQVVSGLDDETVYSLSMKVYTYRDSADKYNQIKATVTFGTKDDEGNFTSLTNGMQGGILENGDNEVDSDAAITIYKKDAIQTATLNFTLPKGANAVEVNLSGSGLGSGGRAYVDDVTLVKASTPIEKVTNGAFELIVGSKTGTTLQSWSLSDNTLVNYEAGTDNTYLKISAENVNATQRMLVNPGKVYKLSFRFSQMGFSEEVTPSVNFSVPAWNGISEDYTVTPTYSSGAESSDPTSWKEYEALVTFENPGNDYGFELINAGLMLNSPEVAWEEGAVVYYDDISLQEIGDVEEDEEEDPQTPLLTNGNFSSLDSEGWATGWIKDGTFTNQKIADTESAGASTGFTNSLQFYGQEGAVYQVVDGVIEEESYELSLDVYAPLADRRVEMSVTYGRVESDGTFTSIDSYDDKSELMVGKMLASTDNVSVYSTVMVSTGYNSSVVRRSLNFTVPKGATAVKVSLDGTGLGSGKSAYVDNVTLERKDSPVEKVNDGDFHITRENNSFDAWWRNDAALAVRETAEDGNSYLKLLGLNADNGYTRLRQRMLLKPGKAYKLSFRFAQTGFTDGVSPDVHVTVGTMNNATSETVAPVYESCSSSSELTWSNYETVFTLDEQNDEYKFGLVNVAMHIDAPTVDTWPEGAAVYYDDISLEEIDVEPSMGFSLGASSKFTTVAAEAKAASLIFVQDSTPVVQKFIVAKYNSTTDVLETASVINAGEGIKADNAKRYDVELDELSGVYYRIFLFDGTTLKPVIDESKRIG